MNKAFQLIPDEASRMAWHVDALALFLTAISIFFTLLILTLIVWFTLYYRARPGHKAQQVHAPLWLEIGWSAIPLALAMLIFLWATAVFVDASRPPGNAMEIYIIGKQWMWKAQHPEGRKEINELHIPVGRPVKLIMTSQDVIHDFGLPEFRIKHDVVPGIYTQEWFTPDRPGEYHLFCDQYCGAQHAEMVGRIIVMNEKDYSRWLAGVSGDEPMYRSGERLVASMNCNSCHGLRAPTFAGLYGSEILLADGRRVRVDEQYLRRAILDPGADIVAGYEANSTILMPSYRGTLDEEQLGAIIEYIKALASQMKTSQPTTAPMSGAIVPEYRTPGAGN